MFICVEEKNYVLPEPPPVQQLSNEIIIEHAPGGAAKSSLFHEAPVLTINSVPVLTYVMAIRAVKEGGAIPTHNASFPNSNPAPST
jgi:hypothetical protein